MIQDDKDACIDLLIFQSAVQVLSIVVDRMSASAGQPEPVTEQPAESPPPAAGAAAADDAVAPVGPSTATAVEGETDEGKVSTVGNFLIISLVDAKINSH